MLREHLFKSLLGFVIGFLLYRNMLMCIPVAGLFLVYSLIDKNPAKDKRKHILTARFRDFL